MRIAITGGIAEGKSTVLGYIADLGHLTASADQIAREVFDDPFTNQKIAELIGASDTATRAAVREAIARSDDVRREINALTHPQIHHRIMASQATFIEVPLLIEACVQGCFDQVWVVTCGPEEQRRRLSARHSNPAQVDALLKLQLPTSAKTPFSDQLIRTNMDSDLVRGIVELSVTAVLDT